MRGVATGLLTAALAVAAHGVGGGGLPPGAATVVARCTRGDRRCVGHDRTPRRRAHGPLRPAHCRPTPRPPDAQRCGPPSRRLVCSARRGDARRPPAGDRRRRGPHSRRATGCGVRCRVPCARRSVCLPGGRAAGACRASSRPTAALSTSTRHFDVAPGSAGQPRPLTDHPTDTESHKRMRFTTGAPSRALIALAVTGATMSIGLLTGTASASAHVRAESDSASPGQTAVVSLPGAGRI